jgi:hypothetical protein
VGESLTAARIAALDAAIRRGLQSGQVGVARSVRWHLHHGEAEVNCEDMMCELTRCLDTWFQTTRVHGKPITNVAERCSAMLGLWADGQIGMVSVSRGTGNPAISLTVLCSKGTLAYSSGQLGDYHV